jgi:hypothetical protein
VQNIATLQNMPKKTDGNNAPNASAPPATDASPDMVAGARLMLDAKDAGLAEAYVSALGDLAWFDAYFAGQNPSAELSQAIDLLAGENSLTLTRAQGFAALSANPQRLDEAQVKLSAIASRDALARVGLLAVRLGRGESREVVSSSAGETIAQLPPQAWSTLARYTLRDLGAITFRTSDTDKIVAEALKLDDAWLNFHRNPQAFYVADVDAVDAGLDIAEPVLVKVAVQNISNRPILIGPGGAISGNIVFDATVRGRLEQPFLGAGVARLAGPVVLPPRGVARGTARVDHGQMFAFMVANPHVPMSIFVSGITNATATENGFIPGPGGLRDQSASVFDRNSRLWDRPDMQKQLTDQLADADPVRRQRAVYTLAGIARALLTASNATEQSKSLAGFILNLVRQASTSDASASVRAVAVQELMSLSSADNLMTLARAGLSSADTETQLRTLLVIAPFKQSDRKQLTAAPPANADVSTRQLANAISALPDINNTPATQPAAN